MAKELRIYPGIGIARLGEGADDFFLSPEVPDLGPLELTADDSIKPIVSFRAANGEVRRQGARFRILEVDLNGGTITSWREITSNDAQIVWRVELANEKAAAGLFKSENQPESATKRNPNDAESDLIIKPIFPTISGAGQRAGATTPGKFKGTDVYLGEFRTDQKGRLIVLGGKGRSVSVPSGLPLGRSTPQHPNNDFANNEGWHDDVADGPVSATVTLPGQAPVELKDGWVIVAPPDFSPFTRGITTLYDIAFQAAVENTWLTAPAEPSYKRDVLPIIMAASGYRWTSRFDVWENIPRKWKDLGLKANDVLRGQVADSLQNIGDFIQNFRYTATQSGTIQKWKTGTFKEDFTDPDPAPAISPDGLTQASLEQGVGGGFYPGIEAGIMMTYKELYGSAFRLKRVTFTHGARQLTPHAGFISRNMACPWQSDFLKCAYQTADSIWWPAQRPIEVMVRKNGALQRGDWAAGINNHLDMRDHVLKLGFVEPDGGSLIEKERSLPRS